MPWLGPAGHYPSTAAECAALVREQPAEMECSSTYFSWVELGDGNCRCVSARADCSSSSKERKAAADSVFSLTEFEAEDVTIEHAGTWVATDSPIVLGVPFGWNVTSSHANTDIFFDARGFKHCTNGQGGKWGTVLQAPEDLKFRHAPGCRGQAACAERIFDREAARACLRNKWVHMDGDSLVRDQFYDLLELLGAQPPCSREKSHQAHVRAVPELNMTLSQGFNPADHSACTPNEWHTIGRSARPPRANPDVWLWSPGLWFMPDMPESAFDQFDKRLECVGRERGDTPLAIFRTTTPYAPPVSRRPNDALHAAQNTRARRVLQEKYGFHVLDAWGIMQPRRAALTMDGVHYTGVGSKWITNALLGQICPES